MTSMAAEDHGQRRAGEPVATTAPMAPEKDRWPRTRWCRS
jgi:hypothetical protein